MRKLYGIAGVKNSGKSTFAKVMINEFSSEGIRANEVAFADPVKASLCAMFEWNASWLNNRGFKENPEPVTGKTPRELMQRLGTDFWRDQISETIWIDLAARNIRRLQLKNIVPIVSDVRFENEADFIRNNGGLIIHVVDPMQKNTDEHESEQGIVVQPYDLLFVNDKAKGDINIGLFVSSHILE